LGAKKRTKRAKLFMGLGNAWSGLQKSLVSQGEDRVSIKITPENTVGTGATGGKLNIGGGGGATLPFEVAGN